MTRISSARKKRCKRKKEVVIGKPDKICEEIKIERGQKGRKLSGKYTVEKCKGGKRKNNVEKYRVKEREMGENKKERGLGTVR